MTLGNLFVCYHSVKPRGFSVMEGELWVYEAIDAARGVSLFLQNCFSTSLFHHSHVSLVQGKILYMLWECLSQLLILFIVIWKKMWPSVLHK